MIFKKHGDRSDDSHAILDEESRIRKAKKIVAVLQQEMDLSKLKVLDIGTGSGHIAVELSKAAKEVHSVDIVDERRIKKGYSFKQIDSEKLPYKAGEFDVVVTNHVVEHVPNQELHLKEIQRVLKKGGYMYLATPNWYWISDPHYRLPFLPVMPKSLGSAYIKLFNRGTEWDVLPISHFKIDKLTPKLDLIPIIPKLLKDPQANKLDVGSGVTNITKYVPAGLLAPSQYVSPTLIYLAKKVR